MRLPRWLTTRGGSWNLDDSQLLLVSLIVNDSTDSQQWGQFPAIMVSRHRKQWTHAGGGKEGDEKKKSGGLF